MNWGQLYSGILAILATATICKLYRAGLIRAYRALGFFFAYQAFTSAVALSMIPGTRLSAYYLDVYCVLMGIGWVVTLAVVLNLLQLILHTLPGILRLSETVLKVVFASAVLFGCFSLILELSVSHAALHAGIVSAVMAVERVVTTIALLTFLGVLTFLSWFKVQLSRNLVVLNVGFLLYFALHDLDYICEVFLPSKDSSFLEMLDAGLTMICYLAWLLSLNSKGEETPVQIGSHWNHLEQDRIVRDLEFINRSLSRRTHRPA